MRILYDTDALVRLTRREELILFRAAISEGQIVHITSDYILDELESVLSLKFNFTKQKAKVTVRLFARLSKVVSPKVIEKVCRDPFDGYVLAAAVEVEVDYLVTEGNDLFILKSYKNIKIVNISTFRHFLDNNI
jgi:putative PIN family toxin of toxin-antitoxin system